MLRVVFVFLLLLSGCTTTAVKQAGTIDLTQDSQYTLAKTPDSLLGQGFLSLVKGNHNGDDYELLVQVEMAADKFVMVGTTVNGVELFELVWFTGKPYELKQSALAKSIEVEYLLADFQLTHWPLNNVKGHLNGAKASQKDNLRVIKQGNQPIIKVNYPAVEMAPITFENLHRGYNLTIKILEKWTL